MKTFMSILGPCIFLAHGLFSLASQAAEEHDHDHHHDEHEVERDHKAHQHGHASLQMVVEENEVIMHFISPAQDIVGFEHEPSNEKQANQVKQAISKLKQADDFITINKQAGCSLEHAEVRNEMLAHDEHDHEKHDHDEHEEDEKEQHSEFEADYHYECDSPKKLEQISFNLFEEFSSLQEIEVQLVTPDSQKQVELEPDNSVIKF